MTYKELVNYLISKANSHDQKELASKLNLLPIGLEIKLYNLAHPAMENFPFVVKLSEALGYDINFSLKNKS